VSEKVLNWSRCYACAKDMPQDGRAQCFDCWKAIELEANRLRTALTESRREVELLRGVYKRECEKNGTGVLVAENATLRQEVERLKVKLANKHLNVSLNAEWAAEVDALRRQVEEQAASLGKVTRSWEEQAAKLAEQDGRIDRLCESGEKDRMDLITERNARMIAESSLAAAQAALRAKDKAMEVARKWATNRRAHEVAEELARAIAVTPSPADGEPSFTMEELKAMKAKLDEPFPAPSEPKEGA
jgi:hypothetical protein